MLDTIILLLCVDPGTSLCLRSKEQCGPAGELVGNHPKGGGQRVTGNGQESGLPKNDCLCNLQGLVLKKNVSRLLKLLRI